MKASLILSISILLLTPAINAEMVTRGLILDLDADRGVRVEEENRVAGWTNQIAASPAQVFVKQDQGRKVPGAGRPEWKQAQAAIGGHGALVFHRQELVNHQEDAFDHLLTGNGYTWVAILRVYPQVTGLKDVNSFFGNLRNGGNYEGFWAGFNDDNSLWAGSRNGLTFGRWDPNNPKVQGPTLREDRFYLLAGRMGAGTGNVTIELFVNQPAAVATQPIPVNPRANPSKMAIGQERDATNHPGAESFDGELARFLVYERTLNDLELKQVFNELSATYQIDIGVGPE